jgi:hypothetical protein
MENPTKTIRNHQKPSETMGFPIYVRETYQILSGSLGLRVDSDVLPATWLSTATP